MPTRKRILTKSRDLLAATADAAVVLAKGERELADRQHLVANQMESLGERLDKQVVAIQAELDEIGLEGNEIPGKAAA